MADENHEGRYVELPFDLPLAENGSNGHASEGPGSAPRRGPTNDGRGDHTSFWHQPLDGSSELHWHHPPLPERESRGGHVESLLEELGGLLGNLRQRAWLFRWNYHTRSAAAATELQDVDREARAQHEAQERRTEVEAPLIQAEMQTLHDARPALEEELAAVRQAYAEAAAEGGLVCEPGVAISPRAVEVALAQSLPATEEMAGAHGISPPGHAPSPVKDVVLGFLAPMVCGFMLAICLGTLVGIISLTDLQRGDRTASLVVAALLGFVVVSLMGEIVANAIQSLASCLDHNANADKDEMAVPRFRNGAGIAVFLLVVAAFLGCAEVTAEGIGIRMLHEQYEQTSLDNLSDARSGAGSAGTAAPQQDLPLGVYLVIGALISGPYLAYKGSKGWAESEARLRESWLRSRQRAWSEARRADPAVRLAFQHAHRVEHLTERQREIDARLQTLREQREALYHVELSPEAKARRQAARAAAVGEAGRLHDAIENIVDLCEPLPQKTDGVSAVTGYSPSTLAPRR